MAAFPNLNPGAWDQSLVDKAGQAATTGTPSSDLVSYLEEHGLGATTQSAQLLTAEEMALEARGGGSGDPLSGFKLTGAETGDFMELFSKAEQFEQATGFRYFPTAAQLQMATDKGWNQLSDMDVFGHFARLAGISDSMPWATIGMTHQNWQDKLGQLSSTVQDITGKASWLDAGFSQADMAKAISQGWSTQRIQQYITGNKKYASQYGWAKHGMSYQQFQDWKSQNKRSIEMQFGAKATNTQAIQAYENPLQAFNASGQPVKTASQNQQFQQSASISSGFQSSVR